MQVNAKRGWRPSFHMAPSEKIGPVVAISGAVLSILLASFIAGAAARYGVVPEHAKLIMPVVMLMMGVLAIFAAGQKFILELRPLGNGIQLAYGLTLALLCVFLNVSILLGASAGTQVAVDDSFSLAYVIASAVVGPVSEEVLFIGFLYKALRRHWSVRAAALVLAMLFSIAHAPRNALSFEARFLYMLNACLLFELVGALWLNVLVHSLLNGLTLSSLILVPLVAPSLTLDAGSLAFLPLAFIAALVLLAWRAYSQCRRHESEQLMGSLHATEPTPAAPTGE